MTPEQKLQKRLLPLYAGGFLHAFVLWYAIEKIFMRSIGFNDQGIALVTIIFTAVMLAVNIPAGIIADRWSRKGMLMVAVVSLLASSLGEGFSHGFVSYTIGACFWGIYYACYGGTEDAIVYDLAIEEMGHAKSYQKYYGRLQVIAGIGLVLGSAASALTTHFFSIRAAYFFTVPFLLAALVAYSFLKEPQLHKKEASGLMGAHFKATFRALKQRGSVLYVICSLMLLSVASRLLYEFDQLWLIALALPAVLFGPVNAFVLSSDILAGAVAGRIHARKAAAGLFAGLALLSVGGLLVHSKLVIIAAITVLLSLLIVLQVVMSRLLHDALPSRVRAGASSIVATAGYAIFLPVAYLFGSLSKQHTIFTAAWVVIVVMFFVSLTTWLSVATAPSKPAV